MKQITSYRHRVEHDAQHVCTTRTCPPIGGYYVSAVDAGRVFLMAGPYRWHSDALRDVQKALKIANDHDGRAWFMSWGTVRVKAGILKPGKLNELFLMPIPILDY